VRAAAAALLLGLAACGGDAGRPQAPVGLHGGIVIEPAHLEIGETATVELALITPPGHRVAPVAPPDAVAGLWVLGAEPPTVEREAARWVHRLRFPVRTRATGRFVWPAQRIEVEAPDGSRSALELPARPFEITEVTAEFPEQRTFFSFRAPPAGEAGPGAWPAALGGALAALAGVALVALVRRARSRNEGLAQEAAEPPAFRQAQAALAMAGELVDDDVTRAADLASAALRLHLARRFGVRALSATTEELAALAPPGAAETHWPEWIDWLRRLDAARFPPGRDPEAVRSVVREAIARGRALVAEGLPRGWTQ
jgi:hypothetical protein